MKYIFLIIILFILSGCSETYLIRYTLQGTATSATVVYYDNGDNIEEDVLLPWSKYVFVKDGGMVGITAQNTSEGELDCIVFFYGKGSVQVFQRAESPTFLIIKGVIHSIL